MVVNDLKELGLGLLNTETVFIQDKLAEWTERLKFMISSVENLSKISWCWLQFWAEKSLVVQMFDLCVAKFLFETWIYKTFEIYPVKNIENYVTFDELSQQQNFWECNSKW